MPLPPTIVDDVIHDDRSIFERGLARVRAGDYPTTGPFEVAYQLIRAILGQPRLSERETAYRIEQVIRSLVWNSRQYIALADAARCLPSVARMAVAQCLPTGLRRLVYSLGTVSRGDSNRGTPDVADDSSRVTEAVTASRCRTVVLLGTLQEHEANIAQLDARGFNPIRANSTSDLMQYLDFSVCGIVVGRGWWHTLESSQHVECLGQLFSHSCFTWLKIEQQGFFSPDFSFADLDKRHTLHNDVRYVRSDNCRINQSDIAQFDRAAETLSNCSHAHLVPGGIDVQQSNLLLAAAARCVEDRNFFGHAQIEHVPLEFVTSGQSAARVCRLEPDDGGPALIGKFHDVTELRREMERFRRHIHWWDERLHPHFYYHAKKGVIIFALVNSPGDRSRVAPTLEDRLRQLAYSDLHSETDNNQLEQDLRTALTRASEQLVRLNSRPCKDDGTASRQWLDTRSLSVMRGRGIEWRIESLNSPDADVFSLADQAKRSAEAHLTAATIHGDVHLRNILVRDDREPFFIDYALSGPGHPCFDLVRLEAAVLYYSFRMTDSEDVVAQMLRDTADSLRDEVSLREAYPTIATSACNRLCMHTILACRDAAHNVLQTYHGSAVHYLAVKYLVACQSLTMPNLQTSVVRAHIRAIADEFRRVYDDASVIAGSNL